MKVCKKCKKEFKDDYDFCPNCGTIYDSNNIINSQNVNHFSPNIDGNSVSKKIGSTVVLIWNIILYIIGGFLTAFGLLAMLGDALSGFLLMLFGLSLFQVFYKLISKKCNSETVDTLLKIARVFLPILLFVLFIFAIPPADPSTINNENTSINQEVVEKDETETNEIKEPSNTENIEENNVQEPVKEVENKEEPVKEEKQQLVFTIVDGEYGDYGRDDYIDGEKYINYYVPYGKYSVEIIKATRNTIGGLYVDSDELFINDDGYSEHVNHMDYNRKAVGDTFEIEVPEGYHIMMLVNCTAKFTKID